MQNTTTPQTPITRFEFNDRMNFLKAKLKFASDAIIYWDTRAADINEDARFGFSLIMDDIVEEMEECVENLEK